MSIELFQRIAFRLTRIAVVIAFLLGIVISVVQIVIDFNEQRSIIDQTSDEIFNVSRDSATRIAFQLDENYAAELINGLKSYQVLKAAQLLDDRNGTLASFELSQSSGILAMVTQWLTGATNHYTFPLIGQDSTIVGSLELTIDNHIALRPFYSRAVYVLFGGFLRNMVLACVLLVVFHYIVTKPLIRLATSLSKIEATEPNEQRINSIENHQQSEIGFIVKTVNEFIDAAEHHQKNLANLEKQLRLIINTVPLLVFSIDKNGRFLFANNQTSLFYRRESAAIIGQSFETIHRPISNRETEYLIAEIDSVFIANKDLLLEDVLLSNHQGKAIHFEISLMPFYYFKQNSVLVVMNDVSERIASQQAIEKLAYHDSLTGLANRTLFQDRLKMDIRRAERSRHFGALLFIDLDKFKLINDTLGHAMGDQMLIDIALKLKQRIRELDTIARMGGDEFAISLSELADTPDQAIERAITIAETFNELLASDIDLAGQGYQISASIGIVCYPQTSNNVATLLRYADAAMYQAKNEGRHAIRVFEQHMIDRVTKQVQVEKEILKAFEADQFSIVLQPLYEVDGTLPISAEILIRWQHPSRGTLSPNEFLGYIESLNATHKISSTAIRLSAELIHQLNIDQLVQRNFRFAINISTLEFYEPDFIQRIITSIQATGLPLALYELEITEGIALHDLHLAKEKLDELQQMGLSIALDDFGTGYSSLSYLKNLNVNKLKIDKSFITEIESDILDQKLVESIIAIAQNFDLKVVIEGVENEPQFDWLKSHANLIYQGYYFK
ncbi:bifunctional diguanylate cyclase/phosphodiesterase [Reinekea sp. G2M2-21]|uniref:putative bifunctional diguanylate cyclase/phosphodiesterase n=1 Tax=Reinekea sp. G2M2-21 TaxID=2788942 RepID=UPI0018A963DB|nr:EAL domain-containing protein [Reinekea sp. G2M2-21]